MGYNPKEDTNPWNAVFMASTKEATTPYKLQHLHKEATTLVQHTWHNLLTKHHCNNNTLHTNLYLQLTSTHTCTHTYLLTYSHTHSTFWNKLIFYLYPPQASKNLSFINQDECVTWNVQQPQQVSSKTSTVRENKCGSNQEIIKTYFTLASISILSHASKHLA